MQLGKKFLAAIFSIIIYSNSAPVSNIQNPPCRPLDLLLFFRYKLMTSLKNHLSSIQGDSAPYWFQAWLRKFPLSAIANPFERRCKQRQIMFLGYQICPRRACRDKKGKSVRYETKNKAPKQFCFEWRRSLLRIVSLASWLKRNKMFILK